MKKLPFSAFICFLAIQSFGQISTDESPPSFSNQLTNQLLQEEYYLPKEAKDQGTISIAHVVHGYRYQRCLDKIWPVRGPVRLT